MAYPCKTPLNNNLIASGGSMRVSRLIAAQDKKQLLHNLSYRFLLVVGGVE